MKITIHIDDNLTRVDQLRSLETSFWGIVNSIASAKKDAKRAYFMVSMPIDGTNRKFKVTGKMKAKLKSLPPLGPRTITTSAPKKGKKKK